MVCDVVDGNEGSGGLPVLGVGVSASNRPVSVQFSRTMNFKQEELQNASMDVIFVEQLPENARVVQPDILCSSSGSGSGSGTAVGSVACVRPCLQDNIDLLLCCFFYLESDR